jgi:ribosomal protein S16
VYEYRSTDIGDKEDPHNKLVVFQIMYPKRGSVLCTLGVWAPTVKDAKALARKFRDENYAGCPVPWRATIKREG